jgi:hypothetical protein
MNFIEFDTTPANESCVSVSKTEEYMPAMRAEANRMKELLEKRFPDVNGYFTIKSITHDFGSYLEMRFYYEDNDAGIKEMQHVEANYPQTWLDAEPVLLYATT